MKVICSRKDILDKKSGRTALTIRPLLRKAMENF